MLPLLLFAATLRCPVLSTASVAGVLGDVEVSVTRAENGAAVTCVFERKDYRLSVEIGELAAPNAFPSFAGSQCKGADVVTLKALGNAAIACRSESGGKVVDKVVGRVRNQAFILALNTLDKASDAKSIRTKIVGLAEQVAGNLF